MADLARIPRILYFIAGALPTLEDQIAADDLSPARVAFRNALHVTNDGALELADGWHGDATPQRYRDAYPPAADAVKAYVAARQAAYDARKAEHEASQKAGLDATAAQAKAEADTKAATAKKAAEEEAKAKADAEAKAKAAAAWKPNA